MSSSLPEMKLDAPAWKREVNSRLAAHRTRRGGNVGSQGALPGMEEVHRAGTAAPEKARTVAEKVAARYAQAPTYSEMLAAEARNAARAAATAATAAAEARDAAQAILIGLDVEREAWDRKAEKREAENREAKQLRSAVPAESPRPHLESSAVRRDVHGNQFGVSRVEGRRAEALRDEASESSDGAEEVFEEEPFAPVQPLPAKLLEFPRELVAARRARPRVAEGPLREEADRSSDPPQLRIFEVEPETISTEPPTEHVLPGWSAIRLDAHPQDHSAGTERQSASTRAHSHPGHEFELPLQTASLEDRLLAAVVDLSLTAAGFLSFVLAFAASSAQLPTGKPVLIGASFALLCFGLMYQALFLCFGQDTPGMRYAKIALCTFDDDNPSRKILRQRLGALLLSGAAMGLGLLWALFDDDRLGWHDRMSRTYQRSYR